MKPFRVKGTSMVEFVIVLPAFLMVFFALMAFSLAIYYKTLFTFAAREGARQGTVLKETKPTENDIKTIVQNYIKNPNNVFPPEITNSNPTISVDGEGGTFGQPLTVTVSYNFSKTLWGGDGIWKWTPTIQAKVSMYHE